MSFSQSILFELLKASMAASLAAAVFVFGQAILKFLFEPIVEMRKLTSQIEHDLIYYANYFSAPNYMSDEKWEKATTAYRTHAAALRGMMLSIPRYEFTAKISSLPTSDQIKKASGALIGISNMPKEPDRDDFAWKNTNFSVVRNSLRIAIE